LLQYAQIVISLLLLDYLVSFEAVDGDAFELKFEEQEGLGRLAEEWVEAYRDILGIYQDLFFSPFRYAKEALRSVQ
jgi:hypothetical protein